VSIWTPALLRRAWPEEGIVGCLRGEYICLTAYDRSVHLHFLGKDASASVLPSPDGATVSATLIQTPDGHEEWISVFDLIVMDDRGGAGGWNVQIKQSPVTADPTLWLIQYPRRAEALAGETGPRGRRLAVG
jgi:hypothetical protein